MGDYILEVNGILLGYDEMCDYIYSSDPFSLFD